MSNQHSKLRPHGGYRRLRSFQATEIIYDGTVSFCDRFVSKRSRTHDQMVQAARSGRQNIAEGSRASATSSKSELKLVNVARASLDELLLDFEDFLRQHKLPAWGKDDPEAMAVRAVGRKNRSDQTGSPTTADYCLWLEHADPGVVANALICLIHQANYLLDRQIAGLEKQFIDKGGYSEQLYAARIEERQKQDQSDPTDPTNKKPCPACDKPMVLRTARKGPKAGSQFWGCSGYPGCKATLPVE
jgi:four helix bundle suffix protein